MSRGSVKLSGQPIFLSTQAEGRWECLEWTWQSMRIVKSFSVVASELLADRFDDAFHSRLLIPDEPPFRSL